MKANFKCNNFINSVDITGELGRSYWSKHPEEVQTIMLKEVDLKLEILMHDWDTKFTQKIDEIMKSSNYEIKKTPIRSARGLH